MTVMYVYHWTHRRNLKSILKHGLRCDYAETMKPEVWVCESSRIGWALGHIAYRHGWSADDMILVRVLRSQCVWVRTAFSGVWVTRGSIPVSVFRGISLGLTRPFRHVAKLRHMTKRK